MREDMGHSKHCLQKHETILHTDITKMVTETITKMVSTESIMIVFFAAKDREALYSWQNQDWKLTVAQIMSSLL